MYISLGQMNIALGQPALNWEKVRAWTAEAARRGSAVVLFPELWPTGYDLENWRAHASPLNEGLFADLSALAREHRIAIGGSLLEAHGDRAYNTFALFGNQGQTLAVYRKTHLFRLMAEDQWLAPGEALTSVAAPWGHTGLSICYDLRFPEIFRRYALQGARLILLPAEWPSRRAEHWRTLLRARAIENQLFVAACNRVGEMHGDAFAGHSAVIDPWGETLAEASQVETLLTVELDLSAVERVRQRIPIFADRRPELY